MAIGMGMGLREPNLAALILAVVILTQLVNWIGKAALQELSFSLYSQLFLSRTYSVQRKLRKQVLEDKAELSRTSSQDEFAKWAKLKRKVDKGLADLEVANATLASSRSSFGYRFSMIIWLLTTGAQLVLVWWFRRQPVFWLPDGWVPAPIAWVLSLPSAPKGSVSSGAWCAVCKRVFQTFEEVVKAAATPTPKPVSGGSAPMPPVPVPTNKGAKIEPLNVEHDKLD